LLMASASFKSILLTSEYEDNEQSINQMFDKIKTYAE